MPIDSTHYVFTAVFFLEWCSSVSYCYRGNAVCQCVIVSVNHYLSIYLSIYLSVYQSIWNDFDEPHSQQFEPKTNRIIGWEVS